VLLTTAQEHASAVIVDPQTENFGYRWAAFECRKQCDPE